MKRCERLISRGEGCSVHMHKADPPQSRVYISCIPPPNVVSPLLSQFPTAFLTSSTLITTPQLSATFFASPLPLHPYTTRPTSHQQRQTMYSVVTSSQHFGINVHQGAVDPSTVTSAPPTEVMRHVLVVLQGMGVVITEESKFRLRCIRPLRRDSGASDRSTGSEDSANSVSVPSHTDYENTEGRGG